MQDKKNFNRPALRFSSTFPQYKQRKLNSISGVAKISENGSEAENQVAFEEVLGDFSPLLEVDTQGMVVRALERRTGIKKRVDFDFSLVKATWFGVTGDGSDCTVALQQAFRFAQAIVVKDSLGSRVSVLLPPGEMVYSDLIATLTEPVVVRGAGEGQSKLRPSSSYAGWAFIVEDLWGNKNNSTEKATIEEYSLESSRRGVSFEGFQITGDRKYPANGIRFVGRNDGVIIRDVIFNTLNGCALSLCDGEDYTPTGAAFENIKVNTMRESRIECRVNYCGNNATPAVRAIHQFGFTGDAFNNIDFDRLEIVYAIGNSGLLLQNLSPKTARRITFQKLWSHGINREQIEKDNQSFENYRSNNHLVRIEGNINRLVIHYHKANHADPNYYCLHIGSLERLRVENIEGTFEPNEQVALDDKTAQVVGWDSEKSFLYLQSLSGLPKLGTVIQGGKSGARASLVQRLQLAPSSLWAILEYEAIQGGGLSVQGGSGIFNIINMDTPESSHLFGIDVGPLASEVIIPNPRAKWSVNNLAGKAVQMSGGHPAIPLQKTSGVSGEDATNAIPVEKDKGFPKVVRKIH